MVYHSSTDGVTSSLYLYSYHRNKLCLYTDQICLARHMVFLKFSHRYVEMTLQKIHLPLQTPRTFQHQYPTSYGNTMGSGISRICSRGLTSIGRITSLNCDAKVEKKRNTNSQKKSLSGQRGRSHNGPPKHATDQPIKRKHSEQKSSSDKLGYFSCNMLSHYFLTK